MKVITTSVKIFGCFALMSVTACGDSSNVNDAISALSVHYAITPPNKKWELASIKPASDAKMVDVVVNVTSDSDVSYLKTLSRMEQLSVAKLACPTATPELKAALGQNLRVWVHLYAQNKEITSSICPVF
ncbi:hypothetical protein [Magnetovibrio blakemorei]|uniref:Uncharacterized protein n=1 Tax=Magnetovibrio blakemorei TaxID=28181 RepID=A0A1E5Q5U2_9PROT|nr:hypothetical protein [Magnetovibrio blakemorei]OEJ65987.1 hypothetical protein BEN30_13415 [Magnetovibrio blakemorei]